MRTAVQPLRSVAVAVIAVPALALVAMGIPAAVAMLDQFGPSGPLFIGVFGSLVLSLTLVGAFVALRVPRNPIGWMLELSGLAAALSIFGGTYVMLAHDRSLSLPLVLPFAWLSNWILVPAIGVLIVLVPLLFPTGRFLTPRWRLFGLASLLGIAGAAAKALMPGPLPDTPWIENPLGLAGAADALTAIGTVSNLVTPFFFAGSVISVILRARRADAVERQQLKWFGSAAAVAVTAFALAVPNAGPISDVAWAVGLITLSLVPAAIGIAILRYRLWDIDRIISRTAGWAIVTGMVVAVFVAAVIGLDAALGGLTQNRTLAVAAATLVAAAVFQPLRRRVQRAVDRRFDRAHADSEALVARFAGRARAETDLDRLTAEVRAVAGEAVRPASSFVWLRTVPISHQDAGS